MESKRRGSGSAEDTGGKGPAGDEGDKTGRSLVPRKRGDLVPTKKGEIVSKRKGEVVLKDTGDVVVTKRGPKRSDSGSGANSGDGRGTKENPSSKDKGKGSGKGFFWLIGAFFAIVATILLLRGMNSKETDEKTDEKNSGARRGTGGGVDKR